jgi:hypothetical protein
MVLTTGRVRGIVPVNLRKNLSGEMEKNGEMGINSW